MQRAELRKHLRRNGVIHEWILVKIDRSTFHVLVGSSGPQSYNNEQVEDRDQTDRYGKRQTERIPHERLIGTDHLPFWPFDRTRHLPIVLHRLGVEKDGQHDDYGRCPDPGAHGEGDPGCPVGHGSNGVADRHVPISAEDREGEDACEPVEGRLDVEDLAHNGAEYPHLLGGGDDQERNAHQEAEVRHGQVENVDVGYGSHVRETQHNKNHETVAGCAPYPDQTVHDVHAEKQGGVLL